jgi:hypothetical protein
VKPALQYSATAESSLDTLGMSHHFTLRDKLTGIELCHYAFQDFVHNGRQHPFIEILAEFAVYRGKRLR